jgi:ubiquinone/menaquinone biosynthesis C-methylase UbiE
MKWQVFAVCVSLIKGTHIYVCDINPNMLNVGKKRVAERGPEHELF